MESCGLWSVLKGLKDSTGLCRALKGPRVLWATGGSEELRRALDGSGALWRTLQGSARLSRALEGSE